MAVFITWRKAATHLLNMAILHQQHEPLLTKEEACSYLRISHKTLERWTAAGRIKAQYFGRRVRYRYEDLCDPTQPKKP